MKARGEEKRRARGLPDTEQQGFGFEEPEPVEAGGQGEKAEPRVEFEEGRRRIFVGEVLLEQYLESHGLKAVKVLGELMGELDVSGFEEGYKPGGRPPIHPRILLSLIVYGMHLRQWSLRELEQLAVRDVGAWFLCRGVQPDHSTLGKFIVKHEKLLSDAFFVSATRSLASKLGLKPGEAAADGTVIQAAAGLRSLAKKEVLEAEAQEARQQAEALARTEPPPRQQAALEKKAQVLEQAVEIATQRAELRQARNQSAPQLSRHEPQAVNQPSKEGLYRLSYKPSLLVHESGLILAQALHPTSEVQVLESLLQQTRQVGVELVSLALDAGYFQIQVLQWAVVNGLDVLCPPERVKRNEAAVAVTHKGLFAKAAFHYEPEQDVYRCPAGHLLRPGQWKVEADTQMRVRHYGTPACKSCPLRAQCTSSASSPRKIGRHEGQELKEAMGEVFEQPAARRRYSRRSHIVEPVFAELKERQGLKRFRRRGSKGARLELALHCLAFNLKRVGRAVAVLAVLALLGLCPSSTLLGLLLASLLFFLAPLLYAPLRRGAACHFPAPSPAP